MYVPNNVLPPTVEATTGVLQTSVNIANKHSFTTSLEISAFELMHNITVHSRGLRTERK